MLNEEWYSKIHTYTLYWMQKRNLCSSEYHHRALASPLGTVLQKRKISVNIGAERTNEKGETD